MLGALYRTLDKLFAAILRRVGTMPSKGKVVDLVPQIKRKELFSRHRWLLSQEDMDRIAADIWPGINGPAPEVTTVKGAAPKKPPLSYEAKHALQSIEEKLELIKFELARLNEHGLKGFEFEALRTASYEDEDLWRGIAAAAKHRRAILAAYRTGKGEWIATIEAFRSDGSIAERTAATAHARCPSREAASEAGRRLMSEKADWLGPDVRLEVTICSALEWQREDEE